MSRASTHAHRLSFDRAAPPALPPPGAGPAPTRLGLRREAAELSGVLGEQLGVPNLLELVVDGVPDGEPFRSLQALLTATAAALEEVSEDALGRSALEQKVQRVRLAEGAPGVSCSQGALTVTAHLAQGSAGRLSDADLRAAIDRAL